MRYVVGFVCVCALGAVPVVGCETAPSECESAADCDDQDECTRDICESCKGWNVPATAGDRLCCYNVLAEDEGIRPRPLCGYLDVSGVCVWGICQENPCSDGSECTGDVSWTDESCRYEPYRNGYPCDWNGSSGVCIGGVCEEDPCINLVCDDGDPCSLDLCLWDGCHHDAQALWDNTPCTSDDVSGICIDGVCQEDPCEGVVCDDGLDCTNEWCFYRTGTCQYSILCNDENICTNDICDPGTGECNYTPADGRSCCAGRWGSEYCDWCLSPSGCWCCSDPGHCQDGRCVAD